MSTENTENTEASEATMSTTATTPTTPMETLETLDDSDSHTKISPQMITIISEVLQELKTHTDARDICRSLSRLVNIVKYDHTLEASQTIMKLDGIETIVSVTSMHSYDIILEYTFWCLDWIFTDETSKNSITKECISRFLKGLSGDLLIKKAFTLKEPELLRCLLRFLRTCESHQHMDGYFSSVLNILISSKYLKQYDIIENCCAILRMSLERKDGIDPTDESFLKKLGLHH